MLWRPCPCVSAAWGLNSTLLVETFHNNSCAALVQFLPSADMVIWSRRKSVVDMGPGRLVDLQNDVDPADFPIEVDRSAV